MNFRSNTAKYNVWLILAIPALATLIQYARDSISYGQVIHQSGDWSLGLLVVALAITPFKQFLPKAKWLHILLFHRRAIGVASFCYAAIHTVVYLERKWGADLILNEAVKPGLATGWVALFIYIALAVTSNNRSVRALGHNWKRLHRAVYLSAALIFVHWILTAFEPKTAYICLGITAFIESIRFLPKTRSL